MSTRISRRGAMAAALGAPLAVLPAYLAGAAPSVSELPEIRATGYFTLSPTLAILIGLLLPAVRKAGRPARLQLVDGDGNLLLTVPLGAGPAFFDLSLGTVNGDAVATDGKRFLLTVKQRGTRNVWTFSVADGNLIALLLPAVQDNGKPVGLVAGSAQFVNGDGIVNGILPFVSLDPGKPQGDGAAFAGPFTAPGGLSSLIGLLLPAVQKVLPAVQGNFKPFELLVLDSQGNTVARASIIGPEGKQGAFSAFFNVFFGDGSVRVDQRQADGSVKTIGQGSSSDGMLIALLLPAVQKNGQTVGPLGGSLQTPTAVVGFMPS
jgi:hypothetical protein